MFQATQKFLSKGGKKRDTDYAMQRVECLHADRSGNGNNVEEFAL